MATRIPVDTDTWWHLRSGDYTLNEGFIYEDPFSHTRQGEAWINHSWGAQIVMYGLHELLGDAGLTLYTAVLATAGMAMLYPVCAGNVYLRAFALVLGAARRRCSGPPDRRWVSFLPERGRVLSVVSLQARGSRLAVVPCAGYVAVGESARGLVDRLHLHRRFHRWGGTRSPVRANR
ncbi:hypothetical protein HC928_18065 [bacterium]|nr:hypothetical protein [bacterium]